MHRIFLFLFLLFAGGNVSAGVVTQAEHEADEISCLALNIYWEARGESTQGQLAVAFVTMNRVHSPRYPDTVCEVVWQPRQFSWTHDGLYDEPTENAAWQKAVHLAEFVYLRLSSHRAAYEAVQQTVGVGETTMHYYNPDLANPRWAKAMRTQRTIGRHRFMA